MNHLLILGATSDMAMACAHDYASRGTALTLAGRNAGQLEKIAADIRIRYSVDCRVAVFDAEALDSHQEFYHQLAGRPDAVFCVFGYLGDQEVAARDWAESERIIMANYTGAVSILNIVANDFEERQSGVIAGFSSVAGERGRQSNYLYGSAKAGFTAYLSGLRNRLYKSGVHVLTVKPGFVNTRMTADLDLPGPLTAQPEQVARAVARAVKKKKNILYVLWMWRPIMYIIKSIPEGIFKRLNL